MPSFAKKTACEPRPSVLFSLVPRTNGMVEAHLPRSACRRVERHSVAELLTLGRILAACALHLACDARLERRRPARIGTRILDEEARPARIVEDGDARGLAIVRHTCRVIRHLKAH